jgi:hypothetical protein
MKAYIEYCTTKDGIDYSKRRRSTSKGEVLAEIALAG